MEKIILLLSAWVMDLLVGDPEKLPHPIVYYGKWIAAGERRLNRGTHRVAKGAVFSLCSILLAFLVPAVVLHIVHSWSSLAYTVLGAILLFYCLAGTTLIREVRMVFLALDESLEKGRKQVARIVGRDTQNLTAQEVRKAALETLAENLSDGVIAPLFWFLLLGVPGALMYKMVNTLDSMIGYQNAKYKDFGCWAAHIDDAFNYLPARITALLMALVSGKKLVPLLKFIRKYSRCHASPNSGWPESALAGILNCRFGGPHDYFGEVFFKPYIGENERELTTKDMQVATRINRKAEILFVVLSVLILLA
jgi:adenosylcobinamide-phosphate synthase